MIRKRSVVKGRINYCLLLTTRQYFNAWGLLLPRWETNDDDIDNDLNGLKDSSRLGMDINSLGWCGVSDNTSAVRNWVWDV